MKKPLKNNSLGHLFGDVARDLNKLTLGPWSKATQQEARERIEKRRAMWAAREARWAKFKKGK